MRVLLVWPNFQADNAAGVRGRAFARGIAAAGADVVVAAPPDAGIEQGAEGYRVVPLPLERDRVSRFGQGRRALRGLARQERPDLVLASSPAALVLLQAHAAFSGETPLVADVRDLAAESLAASYGPRLRYRLLHRFERRVYRSAAAVLAVTGLMREALMQRYGVPPARVHLVPNGADLAAFAPHRGVGKDVDVVFSGAVEGRRVEDLLRGFAMVRKARPDTRFRFLGWRRGPAAQAAERALDRLGLSAAVDLVPPVPHAAVARELPRARLGVVAVEEARVYRMAVGAKVYEYLAAGLPVVALGAPGDSELRRLLSAQGCGAFADGVEEFADSIVSLLDDANRRQAAAAGAIVAAERFDRGRIVAEAWQSVLRPLAEDSA